MIQRCILFAYFSVFFDNRQHHEVPRITRYSMFNQSPGSQAGAVGPGLRTAAAPGGTLGL